LRSALCSSLILLLLFPCVALADTHAAASAAYDDVNTAIDSSSAGDTVVIPGEAKTWTTYVTIPDSKTITLRGSATIGGSGTLTLTSP